MTTADARTERPWEALVDASEEERRAEMTRRYLELDDLPEEERLSRMVALVDAEYALPDDRLRTLTRSRFAVWVALDPETARRVAASYDSAMLQMSSSQAMRWVAMTQTLIKEFPREERALLLVLHPDASGGLREALSADRLELKTPAASEAPASKWWWPFGKQN